MLEYFNEQSNNIGLKISPSSTYISTMVSWLANANVMLERGYEVNWDVAYEAKNFKETGGGEVDVIAASDRVVYSRWQIQCKNTKSKVDVDIVAKEVGLTFVTKADVVMFVTTGECTANAVNYANQVTEVSRYYVILLDKHDIARILEDKARIIEILNIKARRVFAKRELGFRSLEILRRNKTRQAKNQ